MKQESEALFDYDIEARNRNSQAFDLSILQQLKSITCASVDFDKNVKSIMKLKSKQTLWWSDVETQIWSNGKYHIANYRCCPSSRKARNYFCLLLNKFNNNTTVADGWLESI